MSSWGITRADTSDSPGRFGRRPERADRERERERARQVSVASLPEIARAMTMLPAVMCVMTAAHENKRNGMIVTRVMKAADEPACVCVSVPSGQRLATLIRDSHAFGLCMFDPASRLLQKKFGAEESADPFDMLETRTLVTGSPLLSRSIIALDCEVVRHLDLEADHEIYVGQVLSAFVGAPCVLSTVGGLTITPGRGAAGSAE
jgi:flavin reductase (DIM6/NTAB) family NADH-FMN oxidoreductase RutF